MPKQNSSASMKRSDKKRGKGKAIGTTSLILLLLLLAYFIYGSIAPYIADKQVNSFWQNRFSANVFKSDPGDGPDRIRLLTDAEDNAHAFLNAVDSAATNLKLVLHKETCGELSDLSAGALLSAAERGVQIDILVDGKLKAERNSFFRHLAYSPLISIKEYAPISWIKPWTYSSRLKDQFLLADDRLAWFSSAGSGSQGDSEESDKLIKNIDPPAVTDNRQAGQDALYHFDRNVLIYNSQADSRNSSDSVLSQLSNYFTALWTAERSHLVLSGQVEVLSSRENRELDRLKENWQQAQMNNRDLQSALNNYRLETEPVRQISLLKNPVNDMNKEPYIWFTLSQLMGTAQNNVTLCTPDLMLSPDMQRDLEAAISHSGLQIQVLTNAAAVNPSFIKAADYTYNRSRILNTGIRLAEYQNAGGLRGKALLIDDHLTILGSYDWTLSDTYLNTESLLVIDSPEINQAINDQIKALYEKSLTVKLDGSYLLTAEDSGSGRQSGTGSSSTPSQQKLRQKSLLWLVGFFVQLFRSLL